MATGTPLELRGRAARSPSTREVRMPPRLHARPKRSTRPSEATACSRLPRRPVSTASARHDGRRLHAALDKEKAPVARPALENAPGRLRCEGLGLDSAYVESTEGILPATRFAVDAYVHFVRDRTPLEAIASSLTELFAPNLHEERISGMLAHYDFVNPDIMSYFSRRMEQAPRDADFALG